MGPNERLDRSQWDFFWVPSDAEVIERYDVAAVRCARPLPHLNAVTRTRTGAANELVDEMQRWLGRHGSRWHVPDTFDRGPLEAALTRARWAPLTRFEARAIRPEDYAKRASSRFEVRRVETRATLVDAIAVRERAFGRAIPVSEGSLAFELSQCAPRESRVHRFVVYRAGEPVSAGGINWDPALRFAYRWGGGTIAAARGEGAYTALVATRVESARALGAEWVGLYAKEDTSAPIVARQGFEAVGEMRYWVPWRVREARDDELPRLQDLEREAALRFRELDWDDVAAGEPQSIEHLEQAQREGGLFVLDLGGVELGGWAMLSTLDGHAHLEELDVARAHQGRGFGRALVEHAAAHARATGRSSMTLHTFRDVPWNEPLYRRMGFEPFESATPELAARTAHDAGLFPGKRRVCMRRLLE